MNQLIDCTSVSANGRTGIVQNKYRDTIGAALFEGRGCEPAKLGGRGVVSRFPLDDGTGIIRVCRRGGFVRRLLSDSYLFVNRPKREWGIHVHAYKHGLPVPEPLGVRWERHGIVFRGALATREIEGARTLLQFLADAAKETRETLLQVGNLVRKMHDLSIYHGDLQVANILVASASVYILDFGNARLASRLSPAQRAKDLLRFKRSFQKNGLAPAQHRIVLEGYGEIHIPRWLERAYTVKGSASDAAAGRRTSGGEPHAK